MTDIRLLNQMILTDIRNILPKLGITFTESADKLYMACPVHQGTKKTGCSIYLDKGLWYCWTHACQEQHQTNLFAFIKAVLDTTTGGAMKWLQEHFGNLPRSAEPRKAGEQKFNHITDILEKKFEATGISPEIVKQHLQIPSPYFLSRGFSDDILLKYDVGECINPARQMYYRAVVPVYDNYLKVMTGCVGRSLHTQCKLCEMYHTGKCPTTDYDVYRASKWINSKHFKRAENLYNSWYANKFITETGIVIVVEGQGDVWKLEQAGFHNAVGIFGSSMSDTQLFLLEQLPIFNMIILTDEDDAGIKARNKITEQCKRLYNIHTTHLPAKDVGDMTTEQIKQTVGPIVEKL